MENLKNLYEFSAKEKGIDFEVVNEYKGDIISDETRISQILKNLISNALKFTTSGSIVVKVSNSGDEKLPIKIEVEDTGIGIPKDKQELIFEAFSQVDGSTSRKYGGTGLGLSITKELTSLLGGNVKLESKENVGSKFTILLPNLDKKVQVDNDLEIEEPVVSKSEEIVVDIVKDSDVIPVNNINDDRGIVGDNRALLVIDDDRAFCEIVYENIKKHNYNGLIALNGKEGLSLIDNYNISGVLLDLTLPDLDGVEVLKHIKSNSDTKDLPVYIISSRDKDDKFFKLGAKGYGQKPLLEDDIDEIITALDDFIKNHENIIKNDEIEILDDVDLSDVNILVVDDDIKNIFVLDNILAESNGNVFTAYNGQEAIDLLRSNSDIDIVLMDIMMPVMDGYEAIKTIREDSELKNIPIIAVTAKTMKEEKEKCLKIGADDFVSKPIDMEMLISLVKIWSDKKHR